MSDVPLAGVEIVALGSSGSALTTKTAGDGSYAIGALPPGVYTVTFSKPGFHSETLVVGLGLDLTTTAGAMLRPNDSTPPITTSDPITGPEGPVGIILTATDSGGSGVAKTVGCDGGRWTIGTSVIARTPGQHIVEFRSTDLAGNVEKTQSVTFTLSTPKKPALLAAPSPPRRFPPTARS